MRYFFYLFLCFVLTFGAANPRANATQSALFNKGNLLELFKGSTDGSSVISGSAGVGAWQQTPYGKIRLLASDSATDDLKDTLFGLQVEINSGVTLSAPKLDLKSQTNVAKHKFFLPVSLPLQPDKGLVYTKNVTFPFIISLQKSNEALQIAVDLSIDYCQNDACTPDNQTLLLSIPAGKNYFTPFGGFVRRAFDFVPAESDKGQINAGRLSYDSIWLAIDLPDTIKDPVFLLLDSATNKAIPYIIIRQDIQNNKALFIVKLKQADVKKISIFFNARMQMYAQKTPLIQKPIPSDFFQNNTKFPFGLWFVFLLISPTLCLLFKQAPRNEIIAKTQSLQNIICIMAGVLCGVMINLCWPYAALSQSPIWLIFGALLFAFLSFVSYPVTSFGYGFLTAILPLFAFFEAHNVTVPSSFLELLNFYCILAVVCALPFTAFLFKPFWAVRLGKALLHKNHYSMRFAFILDTFLFLYLLLIRFF